MNLLEFSDVAAQEVALSGGKGANLARLTALGFNVPPGLVVTADAYRQFIAQAVWLPQSLGELDFAAPQKLLEQTRALNARLAELPLPAGLEAALAAALPKLPPFVSVRSSATAEDTASAAFAGQHDTYLNVPHGEVVARIKDCWLSLWSDRALLYRRQVGIGLLDTAMAVVVQSMVQAEAAGVAFSVDPVAGDLERIVIDANYGLGESVVSGEAEIDHWLLDQTGQVIAATLAEKSLKIVARPGGGTDHVVLVGAERSAPVLSPAQLAELAQLVGRIAAAYTFPQDIEWALQGGRFYVLQSRPITSIAPRWTREESAERFPNPISPLAWDLVEVGFHQSLNHSFDLMGLPPFEGKWFAMFDSYIYGNQNAVELYANGVPLDIRSLDDLRNALPLIAAKYGWVQDLPVRWSRDLDWYLLRLGQLSAVPLAGLSLNELWSHLLEVRDTGARYFLPNIAISITQRVIYKVLHGMLAMIAGPQAAPPLFDALLASCDTKTGLINAELYRLAQLMQAQAGFFASRDNAALLADWAAVEATAPEFAAGFSKLLAEHGHRETEFDPYVPTWVEAPEVVLATLRVMAQGELHNPRAQERELKMRMQATLFGLQQQIPDDLRYFFSEVVRLAQTYTSLDDVEHYQTTRLTLPMRRAVREIGRRLQELGLVEEAMDAFFARFATLADAITAPNVARWTALAEEIARNKAIYRAACQRTPDWQLGASEEAPASPDGEHWQGIPGSPGRARGPVFLVHGTDDFGRFPKGAVLVARTTNPAWTPLFYGASAVITESGGPLSHGAVTAREMQKPAVMGVRAIMRELQNGEWVEVDGGAGTVVRCEAG